jgi:hypothetical protein
MSSYWWDIINQCRGITKKGKKCTRPPRVAEQIGKDLHIYLTCSLHAEQEKELEKKELTK